MDLNGNQKTPSIDHLRSHRPVDRRYRPLQREKSQSG